MNEKILKLREWCETIRLTKSGKKRINCEGCYECCTTFLMTKSEKEVLNKKKKLWGKGKQYCEFLDKQGKCSVYEDRPIICRIMGTTQSMGYYRCPQRPHNNYTPPIQLLDDYLQGRIEPIEWGTQSAKHILGAKSCKKKDIDEAIKIKYGKKEEKTKKL